jgi:hypothetical protein
LSKTFVDTIFFHAYNATNYRIKIKNNAGPHMNKMIFFCFLTFFFSSVCAFGGGTVFDAEVESILDQQPHLAGFVRSEMEFCRASWYAEIRLAGNYPPGGKRLGPYERRCRPKGTKSNFDFVLTINTSYKGYNAEGKEVDVIKAIKIDERLTSINLRYDPCKEDWCKAPQHL